MKIEIEKSEYDRLKSREEKLMAYYEWFVDKENDLVTVEDIVNKNIKLEEENKKLKSDLSECECSFWFENDEVWFWKWEYKRLKKWIKDHCKWYWNLFPEDEMKRQWKKADKKRK